MNKKTLTKLLRVITVPIVIISLVIFPPWQGIKAWIMPLPNSVQEQVNDAVGYGLDGIIVYVDTAGQESELYSAGWKNRDNKTPADPQALFKIASISKLYLAVATAKLVSNHDLSLDDTLGGYFPELLGRIEYADEITLKQMLQHRSGLPNLTDQPNFKWDNPPETSQEWLDLILDLSADFEPDEKYSYSNTNYFFIGKIIDKALGYPHQQYIKEAILIPLGLSNTYSSLSEVNIDDVMSGYYVGVEADLKSIDFGMLASAKDVGRFLRALNDGSVFSGNEQEIYSEIYVYGHKGWVLGYQSIARYHNNIDTVVVQFVNTVSDETELTALVIYNRIIDILRKEKSNTLPVP
ncbi:beta-lactamase family protein [Pseudoalteromonas shioyasakiensis]|uniref:serine hydrolase domain-containing protein n=1 Tax=Pseudoalteromonas shioyasakiensis TaxID=1190813 RepID=UPI002117960A|nr:serine hydrolase domain-containing protein [Pseudoalteromonas shioyasakiensis]MCQ8879208.1 beta-lactamase family protein [Pseudoalteromonas shioyasakiensis]